MRSPAGVGGGGEFTEAFVQLKTKGKLCVCVCVFALRWTGTGSLYNDPGVSPPPKHLETGTSHDDLYKLERNYLWFQNDSATVTYKPEYSNSSTFIFDVMKYNTGPEQPRSHTFIISEANHLSWVVIWLVPWTATTERLIIFSMNINLMNESQKADLLQQRHHLAEGSCDTSIKPRRSECTP